MITRFIFGRVIDPTDFQNPPVPQTDADVQVQVEQVLKEIYDSRALRAKLTEMISQGMRVRVSIECSAEIGRGFLPAHPSPPEMLTLQMWDERSIEPEPEISNTFSFKDPN